MLLEIEIRETSIEKEKVIKIVEPIIAARKDHNNGMPHLLLEKLLHAGYNKMHPGTGDHLLKPREMWMTDDVWMHVL
jgi:hypothetical protein